MGCAGTSGMKDKSYILAELNIEEDKVNEKIRIINSYEESYNEDNSEYKEKMNEDLKNEEDIKKCEIRINDKIIPFSYFHQFPKKGKYTIRYFFDKLTQANHLFKNCSSLISLDFSHFNILLTSMAEMFTNCTKVEKIDFSKINTQNVTDTSSMFDSCISLQTLDLSNFNAQNLICMECMFYNCKSLKYLKLFNIQKCEFFGSIFSGCDALEKENIIVQDQRILDEFEENKNRGQNCVGEEEHRYYEDNEERA